MVQLKVFKTNINSPLKEKKYYVILTGCVEVGVGKRVTSSLTYFCMVNHHTFCNPLTFLKVLCLFCHSVNNFIIVLQNKVIICFYSLSDTLRYSWMKKIKGRCKKNLIVVDMSATCLQLSVRPPPVRQKNFYCGHRKKIVFFL